MSKNNLKSPEDILKEVEAAKTQEEKISILTTWGRTVAREQRYNVIDALRASGRTIDSEEAVHIAHNTKSPL